MGLKWIAIAGSSNVVHDDCDRVTSHFAINEDFILFACVHVCANYGEQKAIITVDCR